MTDDRLEYRGPDGTPWQVEIKVPGSSNAMVMFQHPDPSTSGLNRYAWVNWRGPEARSVTGSLSREAIRRILTPERIALLFRRSAPISPGNTPLVDVRQG